MDFAQMDFSNIRSKDLQTSSHGGQHSVSAPGRLSLTAKIFAHQSLQLAQLAKISARSSSGGVVIQYNAALKPLVAPT